MSRYTPDLPDDFDQVAMTAALRAAVVGLGAASPNPAVGAVIAVEGQLIAAGGHQRAGQQHAEAVALVGAGQAAEGATAYVSSSLVGMSGVSPRVLTV